MLKSLVSKRENKEHGERRTMPKYSSQRILEKILDFNWAFQGRKRTAGEENILIKALWSSVVAAAQSHLGDTELYLHCFTDDPSGTITFFFLVRLLSRRFMRDCTCTQKDRLITVEIYALSYV